MEEGAGSFKILCAISTVILNIYSNFIHNRQKLETPQMYFG